MDPPDRVFELYRQGKDPFDIAQELGLDFERASELFVEELKRRAKTLPSTWPRSLASRRHGGRTRS